MGANLRIVGYLRLPTYYNLITVIREETTMIATNKMTDAVQPNSSVLIIPRITARILIEHDNQYLYLLQTDERGGELSLPGGRVKNKEFIRKGLVREVLEETNLTISKKDLQAIHTLHRKENGEFEVTIYFKIVIEDASDLALNEPEKFQNFVWFSKDKIPQNLMKEFRYVLKNIKKEKFFSEYPKRKKALEA
jgi:ADP-ribose pyrophosphatase YjhB (NUDIX family)